MGPMSRRAPQSEQSQSPFAAGGSARGQAATDEQLEFALRAGRMGSWEFDIAAGLFTTSAYCRVVFGLGPDDPFDRIEDLLALVHPDDRAKRQAAIDKAVAEHGEMEVEYRTFRPDGSIGWVLARGRAVYEDGRAVRMAGISMDVTARKAAEQRQALLIHELNHRVKNTLATVQSLAAQSQQGADPAVGEPFIERLFALSRVHDMLSETAWEGASLRDVVTRTLEPYDETTRRFTVSGPVVNLAPNAAVSLNMVFHELATNATKYGALSVGEGRIDIAWRAQAGVLLIDWRESGGPAVTEPPRRGFGSRLIERGLARELDSDARLVFEPQGLSCHIRLPLSEKLTLAGGA
jgi:two-component sensor histidine kinase